jgi:DinB superfamily
MNDRRSEIISELENSLEDSVDFFKSLKPEQLRVKVYQDDQSWTVKQMLAHFITIERSMHWLFNNILSGGPGSPGNFDVDRFNRTQPLKLYDHSVEELIEQFRQVRLGTISIVSGMDEKDLDREGVHAFHGDGKLERFIRWAYEHARIHENDIRKALYND